jgi:hypothetical protein
MMCQDSGVRQLALRVLLRGGVPTLARLAGNFCGFVLSYEIVDMFEGRLTLAEVLLQHHLRSSLGIC